jgi:TonB-linked SusC/RagA family outer membrane protein
MKNNYRRSYAYALTFALFLTYNSPTFSQNQPQKTISGIITDGADPLIGVNVLVKNSARGSISDLEGRYSVKASANDTLVFTYVGYKTQEVAVGSLSRSLSRSRSGSDGDIVFNVVMEVDAQALDAVVINAGYYKVSDREKTGSISRITATEIENQTVLNPLGAIQGRLAGLNIVPISGVPGSGFNVLIRGKGSILAGSQPLYIIDGVPFSSQSLSSPDLSGSTLPNGDFSPFSFLNPSDIESIEVLKDADATAIYGSRGANGVILITTKKGRKENTSYTFTAKSGLGQIAKKQKLLNTAQYLQMRQQAFQNDGITEYPPYAYDVNGTWSQDRDTNWQKELLGGTAYFQDYRASINGGNDKTSFFLSGGYRNESSVFIEDTSYKRASGLAKVNHGTADDRLKLSFSLAYTHEDNDLPDADLSYQALILPPNAPSLYNEDGSLNWEDGTFNNPLGALEGDLRARRNSLLTNLMLDLKLGHNLNLKTNVGYQDTNLEEYHTFPHTLYPPIYGFTSLFSSSYFNMGKGSSWIVEPQLNYRYITPKSKLDVLVGYSAQNDRSSILTQYAEGFSSNAQIMNAAAANFIKITEDSERVYKYQAVFGRVNYTFMDRYIINLTGRRDGSSRFGPNNRFANFGALGAAWIFSEEDFFKNDLSFLTYGKIRGSYGTTGNDQIGDYRYLNSYGSSGTLYNGTIGLYPTALYNPDFGWEINRKAEIAIELGFFDNRINTTVNYYHNRSSNQLVEIPLPATTGFGGILGNLDALVANSGWEFELTARNIDSEKWKWTTSFALTIPRNELLEFPNLENSTYANSYVIGEPITIRKVLHYTGVDPETGVYTFEDYNGDGQISVPEDSQKIVDLAPKFYGGLSNTLEFQNLELQLFLQFNKQLAENSNIFGTTPGAQVNQTIDVLDAWTGPGDQTNTQAFTTGANYGRTLASINFKNSDASFSDASYIRLKTLSLAYNLRNLITNSSNTKVFIQGQNLFTLTDFKGQDPEQTQGFIPALRWLGAGFTLTF